MPTATALASIAKDPTRLSPHTIAEDVARRMTSLLETIPEEMQNSLAGADDHPARAAIGRDGWSPSLSDKGTFDADRQVLRVEVSVDGTRVLRDAEYRQSLVDDARFAALEFLKPLVRG